MQLGPLLFRSRHTYLWYSVRFKNKPLALSPVYPHRERMRNTRPVLLHKFQLIYSLEENSYHNYYTEFLWRDNVDFFFFLEEHRLFSESQWGPKKQWFSPLTFNVWKKKNPLTHFSKYIYIFLWCTESHKGLEWYESDSVVKTKTIAFLESDKVELT